MTSSTTTSRSSAWPTGPTPSGPYSSPKALYRADDPALRVALVRLLGRTGAASAVLVRGVLLCVAAATDERDVAFHEAFDRLGAHIEERPPR
jgi:hypothetical protein